MTSEGGAVGVLEGFMATWTKARNTFGEGAPPSGERFDQSGQLRSFQNKVESAAPGSGWTGAASTAYGKANSDHAKVFGDLATLDQRFGAKVTQSGDIVRTGRQNLDALKQWVTDAAGSVPAGTNREQLLLPIVSKGLGQLQNIVKDSNGQLNGVANDIKLLGSEYDKLGKQKFAPKEGPDLQGIKGDEEKALKPEDMQEVVTKALHGGDSTAAGQVNDVLDSINPDQLGPNSKAHPLTPLQAETVGQMQAQMKPMSLKDLDAARKRLGENKGILGDAMQVMSDPDVTYPRHDKDGPQVVATSPGYPLPNYGVLPGDRGALPDSVQHVLNQGGKFDGPPGPQVGYPGSGPVDHQGGDRHEAGEGLKSLANIVDDGHPKFQQGSELDRGMMHSAKEFLHSQSGGPNGQEHWGDEVVQRVFETAGKDTVVDHDMFKSDKEFTHDVLTHEWKDDGKAASTLTDWIGKSAESTDPVVNARAGETASALAGYMGDPANKDAMMNIKAETQENVSMGKLNPELAQSLARAMSPYVDEMAGRNIDNTSGWQPIDDKSDLSYPHATNVFAALGTDDGSAAVLDGRSTQVQAAFINDYAHSVIEPNGPVDRSAMEAAGRLKGITDQGAYLSEFDSHSDAAEARKLAHERLSNTYDTVKDMAGLTPFAGPALTLQADLMKLAILGPEPSGPDPGHASIQSSEAMQSALASAFIQHGVGNPGTLSEYLNSSGDQLLTPASDPNSRDYVAYQNALHAYFTTIADQTSDPLGAYDKAYRDVIQ